MSVLKHTDAEASLLAMLPTGDTRNWLQKSGLPSRRAEDWRWSDLRGTLNNSLRRFDPSADNVPAAPIDLPQAIELVFLNDTLTQPDKLPEGVSIKDDKPYEIEPRADIADVAAALTKIPVTICVEADCLTPIMLRFISTQESVSAAHVQVHIAENVGCSFVESYEVGQGEQFSLIEYFVGTKARVNRTILQHGSEDAVTIPESLVLMMAEAAFHQTTLGFGGKLTRMETRLQHGGEEARAIINGVSLLSGNNHLDHTTRVDHNVPNCVTKELYKSAISGKARGVFQGKFYVDRGAQQTDAQMAHHALLLSDTAEVRAKPELEIYADDVECAHGNTAGAMDENALFYMRQRGLSETQSKAMLVEAFAGEILEQVEDETIREQLELLVAEWMRVQL